MTDRLKAAAQALVNRWDSPQWGGSAENLRHTGEYIAALRAALAEQPSEQEPVADLKERCAEILAWQKTGILRGAALHQYANRLYGDDPHAIKLAEAQTARDAYRWIIATTEAPQPAKRVQLTDEEISALWLDSISGPLTATKFARAVERAHGITGETK